MAADNEVGITVEQVVDALNDEETGLEGQMVWDMYIEASKPETRDPGVMSGLMQLISRVTGISTDDIKALKRTIVPRQRGERRTIEAAVAEAEAKAEERHAEQLKALQAQLEALQARLDSQ